VTLSGHVVAQALVLAAVQAEIDVVEQIAAEDQKTLDLVKVAFEAGGGVQRDVLAAESQRASDLALLPALRQRASVARHALAILTGQRPADWAPPNFTLGEFTLPRELPMVLPSEMVRKRPDILAAESNLHAASAAIGVATANLYPQITLSADFLQEALTPRGLFEASSAAWATAAHLSAPLFNGGRLTAEKREAQHAYQAALAQYQQIVLRAFGQVADALTALQHDAEAIAAEQKALSLANASLDLARKSYDAGSTGLLPVEDAQRRLTMAKLGLTRAQSQRYLDTAGLFVALGGTPLEK
jgi:NodT family efflux transporter outer membrane factor (OMF) lipoprotein